VAIATGGGADSARKAGKGSQLWGKSVEIGVDFVYIGLLFLLKGERAGEVADKPPNPGKEREGKSPEKTEEESLAQMRPVGASINVLILRSLKVTAPIVKEEGIVQLLEGSTRKRGRPHNILFT